jgi:hypothetical protein
MAEQTEGTIALLSTKIAKKDKEHYFSACKSRGVKPSFITRKLIAMWMAGEIKLEI